MAFWVEKRGDSCRSGHWVAASHVRLQRSRVWCRCSCSGPGRFSLLVCEVWSSAGGLWHRAKDIPENYFVCNFRVDLKLIWENGKFLGITTLLDMFQGWRIFKFSKIKFKILRLNQLILEIPTLPTLSSFNFMSISTPKLSNQSCHPFRH